MTNMKICRKCNIEKTEMNFYKAKSNKDGLNNQCKNCFKEEVKTNTSKKDKLVIKEKNKEWRKIRMENPDYRKSLNQKGKKYYKENKEQHRKSMTEWYENNKEAYLLGRKDYYKNNKADFRKRDANRRALELNAVLKNLCPIIKQELKVIYKNCPEGYEVDHIIPLNNSIVCGLHVPWNLQYLTIEENRKKSNKLIKEINNA